MMAHKNCVQGHPLSLKLKWPLIAQETQIGPLEWALCILHIPSCILPIFANYDPISNVFIMLIQLLQ